MENKTKTSLVILIVAVLLAVGGFIIFHRFTPKSLKADIQSHPETTTKNEANLVDSSLNIELLEAAGKGNLQEVQRLVREGADVNARDAEGTTALTRATMLGHSEIVKFLLNNTSLDSKQKLTALMWAQRGGHAEIIQLLKEAGANIADASLNDQLLYAAIEGDIEDVKLLLNKGIKVDVRDTKDGSTALILAGEKGHQQIIELLLDRGADVNAESNFGGTALLCAVLEKHLKIAQFLIEKGADVNAKHAGTNITVLMIAAGQGYTELVSILLEKGADVNVEDQRGYTALLHAAGKGQSEIVKLLVKKGRWTNLKESFGRALAVAIAQGQREIAKLLIEKGADVNKKSRRYGFTTLMSAANRGDIEIVQALINKGADVNATARNGLTALAIAENRGHLEIVRLLKKAGAKKN